MPFKVNFLGLLFYFVFKVRLQVTSKYLITALSNDHPRSLLAKVNSMADRSPQRGGFLFLLHGWKYDEWFLSKSLTPVHRSDTVLITERLQSNDPEPFINGQVARYLREQRKDLQCRGLWQELSMPCTKDISTCYRPERFFCLWTSFPNGKAGASSLLLLLQTEDVWCEVHEWLHREGPWCPLYWRH